MGDKYIMKNKLMIAIAVIAAVALISGAGMMALAATGTQADPLVTLSYLTNRFRPQILDELRGDITRSEQAITQRVDAQVAEINARITAGQDGAAGQDAADTFAVVTLRNGQRLVGSVGTEIMLRIGTANGYQRVAPALVNVTGGTSLGGGTALVTNHMYMVTIEGNGITATADLVRVLVRGDYTISN